MAPNVHLVYSLFRQGRASTEVLDLGHYVTTNTLIKLKCKLEQMNGMQKPTEKSLKFPALPTTYAKQDIEKPKTAKVCTRG